MPIRFTNLRGQIPPYLLRVCGIELHAAKQRLFVAVLMFLLTMNLGASLVSAPTAAKETRLPDYEATADIVIRGVCNITPGESFLNIYIGTHYTIYRASFMSGNVLFKMSTKTGLRFFAQFPNSYGPMEISPDEWSEVLITEAPGLFDNIHSNGLFTPNSDCTILALEERAK